MAEFNTLDDASIEAIEALIAQNIRRLQNGRWEDTTPAWASPSVYIAKLPTGGIPARSGTTPGKASCEVQKITLSAELTPSSGGTLSGFANPDASKISQLVWNIYPVKWYYSAAEDIYIQVTQNQSGLWLCEKPEYTYKAKAKADITAGNHASTGLYINGAEVEAVEGYNDWMNGGIKISSGKEGMIRYFEDQGHWSWVEAECE